MTFVSFVVFLGPTLWKAGRRTSSTVWERDLSYFTYTSSIISTIDCIRDTFNAIFNSRIKDTRFEFYSILSFSFLFALSYLKISILFSCFLVSFYSSLLCFEIYGDVLFRSALPSRPAFLNVTRVDPTDSLPETSCKLSAFNVLF